MPKVKRLFLARHGESLANQQKLISGQLDFPLSEKGLSQAHWLFEVLRHEPLEAIYVSGLQRTLQTAEPTAVYHSLTMQILDDLKEIHFGALQGQTSLNGTADVQQLWQTKAVPAAAAIPGGETVESFELRVSDCLDKLVPQLPDCALLVAHRNTNAFILRKLLGISREINIKNKYVYEIELTGQPTINTIRLGGEFHGKKFSGLKDD